MESLPIDTVKRGIERQAKQIRWTVCEIADRDPDTERDITPDRLRRSYNAMYGSGEWGEVPVWVKNEFRNALKAEYDRLIDEEPYPEHAIDRERERESELEDWTYDVIEETIDDAKDAVMGDRNDSHGHPAENHGTIAAFWSAYFDIDVTDTDVAVAFMLAKISRHRNGGADRDHFRDVVGYAGIANGLEFGGGPPEDGDE